MAISSGFSLVIPSLQSIKLDGHNYPLWRNRLLSIFDDQDLMGHLDGSLPPPPPFNYPSPPIPNPEFARWFCTDQVLLCLIYATLSEEILYNVVGSSSSSSRELWVRLEKMFASQTRVSALHLQVQLQSIKKNSMTVNEYFWKIKSLSDALAAMQKPVEDSDLVLFALTGLGPDYEDFLSFISKRAEPPSLQELYGLLLCHESRLYSNSRF